MSYQITIGGQIYVFGSSGEYNKVKQMSSNEQKAYVENNNSEEELQELDGDFEEESSNTENTAVSNLAVIEENIHTLEKQRTNTYSKLAKAKDKDEIEEIYREAADIQSKITSLRSQAIQYLQNFEEGDSISDSAALPTRTGNINGNSGSSIVDFAEKYLGEKYASKSAENNPFVRVQRGGSCDDFATYVIDNSTDKENLADWYTNLSEKNKAWGPDIFRAAKAAGATVSKDEAQAGDLASIDLDGNGGMDHTVIVKEIKDGKLYTVESNGGKIQNKTYNVKQICTIARVTKS